jgi:hypothetical protein
MGHSKSRNRVDAPTGVHWRIAMKKAMVTLLTGVLLLSAALPAFVHHHHHRHHHHHAVVVIG